MVSRGEVYLAALGARIGHEQGGDRPVLIVSAPAWLKSSPPVIAVLPLTRTYRQRSTHVEIETGTSGLAATSYAKCEDVRAISPSRLRHRFGEADEVVMARIDTLLRRLLGL
jgi:mRNA interferase MazF